MAYSKAIGVVRQQFRDSSVGIKVLALKNGKEYIHDEEIIQQICPPIGCVFAHSFYERTDSLDKEILAFSFQENQSKEESGKHKMIIDYSSTPRKVGYEVLKSEHDIALNNSIDFHLLQAFKSSGVNKFYIRFENKIYGSFKIKNEQIIPNTGKVVTCWTNPDLKKITWEEREFFLEEPKGDSQLIDCMTPSQLEAWFQCELKKIDNPLIKTLKSNVDWKNTFNELFSNKTDDNLKKARFFKVIKSLSDIELSYQQLLGLANESSTFKKLYKSKMEVLKEEMEVEFKEKREKLKLEIEEFQKDFSSIQSNVIFLEEMKEKLEKELKYLKTKEEEIIRYLRISAKIAPPHIIDSSINVSQLKSYIVEHILPEKHTFQFNNKDKFLKNLKSYLSKYHCYSRRIELRIFENLANYKCFFVPDMYCAIAIVKATNNCTYIIQQAEADWLKFENFWKNGLGEIWELSHQHPERLHFLILQDINLASPDCYARPLLDVNSGIRNKLPFSDSVFPKNLRIIATRLPSEQPEEIGLPLYRRSFEKWGAIKRIEHQSNLNSQEDLNPIDNYLSFHHLEVWNNYSEDELDVKFEETLNEYFDS